MTAFPKTLKVSRLTSVPAIDSSWDKKEWSTIEAIKIDNYMGRLPEHQPKTLAKMGYDSENIYVIFKVEDQFVRAVTDGFHEPVWEDSCCEFFFTPGKDIDKGYFNLEMNCGGTLLLHFNKVARKDMVEVDVADCKKIEISASLPPIIDPEITEPTTWMLEYKIPIAILEKYTTVEKPATGVTWKGNFYKCGDKTSQPHWLTWSVVDEPDPNFHVPESFGSLEFV